MLTALLLAAAFDTSSVCTELAKFRVPERAAPEVAECSGDDYCLVELAEQYANGEGVDRNYDLALFLLCQTSGRVAPAETDGMIEHVVAMREGETREDLDYCDHVTSGVGQGRCASAEFSELMPRLEERLTALRTKSNTPELFAALEQTARRYVAVETERIGEQSRGGTAYAAIVTETELDETQKFVDTIAARTATRAAPATDEDLRDADRDLNENYREELARWTGISSAEPGKVTELFRTAQRAWIAWRDAFAAYYVARWRGIATPDVLRRELVTELTRARATELREP